MKMDIEEYTGQNIEELFVYYKFLVKPTILKYYSRYFSTMWIDDIFSCGQIGLYNGLININMDKVVDERSICAALVWAIRKEIKNFERSLFGAEKSNKREQIYKTSSYDKPVAEGCNLLQILSSSNSLSNEKDNFSIEDRIDHIDLYNEIEKLDEDEKYLIKRLLNDTTLEKIGEEMNISKDKVFRIKRKVFEKLKRRLKLKY